MSLHKKLFLSSVMAVMILFPMLNKVMDTGVLFLLIPYAILGVMAVRGRGRNVFRSTAWMTAVWPKVFVLFTLAIGLRLAGVWSAGNHQVGEYVVAASIILLYPALKPLADWDWGYLHVSVFAGIWILALYLIDTALFPGSMLIFGKDQDTLNYINMTAYMVILMAFGMYMYSGDRVMRLVSIAGAVVSALGIAINGAWGTAFMVFVMLIVHAAAIVPVAEIMKRVLQLFFGFALFFCNMSPLINYSKFIHVEGLEYRLECEVAGELLLCLLAIYVFRRWDRIPSGIDLRRIKLTRLQKGCRSFLKVTAALLAPTALLSLVDGRLRAADLEATNLIQLFAGEKWEEIKQGVPAVTLLSLFGHMNEALTQMWKGNVFAVSYQMYGWPGVAAALAGAVLLCRRLYFVIRGRRTADDYIVWLTVGIMGALFCLPMTMYMLPAYLMPVFMAVCSGE